MQKTAPPEQFNQKLKTLRRTPTYILYMCRRVSVYVYGVLPYNVGDGCTTKHEIIFIQFPSLIFTFLFRSRFFQFFCFRYR